MIITWRQELVNHSQCMLDKYSVTAVVPSLQVAHEQLVEAGVALQ